MKIWHCTTCGDRLHISYLTTEWDACERECLQCPSCGARYNPYMSNGKRSENIREMGFETLKAILGTGHPES